MSDRPVQPNLAAALAAVQADLPPVAKTKTAKVKGETKDGRRFDYEYKYADLADVSAAVMPLMGKHGLAFTCQPGERPDGRLGVAYQLLHESGELIDGWFPIRPDLKMQDIGGSITYIRRYALCSLIGVAADEDTDAQHLDEPAPTREKPPQRAAGNLPRNSRGQTARSRVTDEELAATGQMTDAQLREHNRLEREVKAPEPGRTERLATTPDDDPWLEPLPAPKAAGDPAQAIAMHFGRLGITDRDVRLGLTGVLIGRPGLKSSKELTAYEALALKRALEKCRNAEAFTDFFDHEADAFRADIAEHRKEAQRA